MADPCGEIQWAQVGLELGIGSWGQRYRGFQCICIGSNSEDKHVDVPGVGGVASAVRSIPLPLLPLGAGDVPQKRVELVVLLTKRGPKD